MLLLKFIESKITGNAKDRLLARSERGTWEQFKVILEENYLVKRTLEYYAGILFNSKQYFNDGVAQCGARIDAVAIELKREVRNRLEKTERREGEDAHYVERVRLIIDTHLAVSPVRLLVSAFSSVVFCCFGSPRGP